MAKATQVDRLSSAWEEVRESRPEVSLDRFIEHRLGGIDDDLVQQFRRKAEELAAVDQQMQEVAAKPSTAGHSSKRSNGQSVLNLSALRPGLKPIRGYTLVSRLGGGGFGEVWKAESPGGFHVALKFVQIGGRSGEIEERSLKVIKDVRHPNLLSVFGMWRAKNALIIAMELADRTLLDRLHEAQKEGHQGIPKEELLEYIAEAAKGIDALNDPGSSGRMRIQHRDIKPQNLLLSGGSVKVGDFGLARSLQYDVTGHTGSLTFAYAAPECFDGTTSNRSDQYSLAVTYCHLRGGQLPFDGNQVQVMDGHRKKRPDLSMLPEEERPAVAKALEKLSKDRWNSCSEFVQALVSASTGESASAPDPQRSIQRRLADLPKTWKIAAALLAVLLLAGGSFLFLPYTGESATEQSLVAINSPTAPAGDAADTKPQSATVAVMDFENHSKDPALDGFRLGFRDMLVTDLSRVSSVKVLERARLKDLLAEHELATSPFINPREAVRLGKGLSAQSVLTGSYTIAQDDIRIDVRLVSVETGEVLMADTVSGKKTDLFPLQEALSTKVLAGLEVTPTEEEQQALTSPQTRKFEAFRLYSDARLAQIQGNRNEAVKRFQAALKQDPKFELAARELDQLETEALFRQTEAQKQKTATSGEVGQRLQEHWDKYQKIAEKNRRDAEYFASLIILSAHAGLSGDTDRERQLLLAYWRQFTKSVPPEQAVSIADEMRVILLREGEFFQKNVDSGDYDAGMSKSSGAEYLRSELRGALHWPQWSAIWPFDRGLRMSFMMMEHVNKAKANVQLGPEWFDERLPRLPHEYLENICDDAWKKTRKDRERYEELFHLSLSTASYYASIPNKTKDLNDVYDKVRGRVLTLLDRMDLLKWEDNFLEEALPILEALAKTEVGTEDQERANKLLIRFTRQLRMNKGLPVKPSTAGGSPMELFGQPIEGSLILFVWSSDSFNPDFGQMNLENRVRGQLGDVVRAMSPDTVFNFQSAGCVRGKEAQPLFAQPRPATPEAKKAALEWIAAFKPHVIADPSLSLESVIEQIVRDYDDKCLVVLLSLNSRHKLPQNTIDFALRSKSCPRFCVFANEDQKLLRKLAAASHGTGVLLKSEGGLLDSKMISATKWDVSAEKPETGTSAVQPVEPTQLTLGDFGCESRIADKQGRAYLEAAIRQHLEHFDPERASTTRYFTSLAILAQIAGRIGHHQLEDALTRKWWTEIEPLALPDAAIAYEKEQQKPRDKRDDLQPLLLELKSHIDDEVGELWSASDLPESLSRLPQATLAPDKPTTWASPISWLRGVGYREQMESDLCMRLIDYHCRAGSEFNTKFLGSGSADWMLDLVNNHSKEGRWATASRIADSVFRLLETLPPELLKKERQKLKTLKQEILQKHPTAEDWIATEEYAPRRPWRGVAKTPNRLPFFGRDVKVENGVVVVFDMSTGGGDRSSEKLRGLSLALTEAGEGIQLRCILSGRENYAWPEGRGMALLDTENRSRLLSWVERQYQEDQKASSSSSGTLNAAVTQAMAVRNGAGDRPSAIVVACQTVEAEKAQTKGSSRLPKGSPFHIFAMPPLGGSFESLQQQAQIEKMRRLAKETGGQFTVVPEDWIWLYLAK